MPVTRKSPQPLPRARYTRTETVAIFERFREQRPQPQG